MSIKVKVKVDRAKLKAIIARKRKLIHNNIEAVLRNEAVPYLIALIMSGYDALSDRMSLLPEDPTNPAYWRDEFIELLWRDFQDNFLVQDNKIIIRLGDRETLGYTASQEQTADDDQPVHWLVFYLEGLLGEWAFISPETYELLTGRRYKDKWGKFGQGFMISRDDYYANGWHRTVAFEDIRHPFSGFAPLDIFREAVNSFKLRPFIQKALDAASDGRRL